MNLSNIGSLASLTKNVIDIIKNIWDLVDKKQDADQELVTYTQSLKASFKFFQNRISYLSIQISQMETLTRMLPLWIEKTNQLEDKTWNQNLDYQFIKNLDSDFELFLRESISDTFSAMFFITSFDKLTGVNERIEEIRKDLIQLKTDVEAIPSLDLQSWQVHLPIIKVHLKDLKKKGTNLDYYCIDLRGKLINELKEVATIKADF